MHQHFGSDTGSIPRMASAPRPSRPTPPATLHTFSLVSLSPRKSQRVARVDSRLGRSTSSWPRPLPRGRPVAPLPLPQQPRARVFATTSSRPSRLNEPEDSVPATSRDAASAAKSQDDELAESLPPTRSPLTPSPHAPHSARRKATRPWPLALFLGPRRSRARRHRSSPTTPLCGGRRRPQHWPNPVGVREASPTCTVPGTSC